MFEFNNDTPISSEFMALIKSTIKNYGENLYGIYYCPGSNRLWVGNVFEYIELEVYCLRDILNRSTSGYAELLLGIFKSQSDAYEALARLARPGVDKIINELSPHEAIKEIENKFKEDLIV